ncbi:MAG TPA: pitrilysin family protein [Xanthobacteraceae bacterium]|nr:pitrilysin family protein [Xanthobacteraceae bacterium]
MRCFGKIAAACFLLLVVTNGSQAQTPGTPKASHYSLQNGLELVVIPDHRAPVVTHMVWYRVGGADETAGKSGIAHFLEHLMFKGTEKHPNGEFSNTVTHIGGQENAFTTSDYTAFYQRVPRDKLALMMELEADRMTNLKLTDAVVLSERDVVLEEQNMRVANNPNAKLAEQIDAALYLNSPYGRPVIGWRGEIEKLNREDAIAFYNRFYTPNNATVVVAGDVEPADVFALAQKYYGPVKPRVVIKPRVRPQEPEQIAARTVTLADPRVEQPSLRRAYLAPSSRLAKKGEDQALEVLAHVLGGDSTSMLYRDLVLQKNLAVSVGTYYNDSVLDMGSFSVYGAPRPGVTLPQMEAEIDAVLAKVVANGVEAKDLERSKARLIAESIYARDSQMTQARWYGTALSTGETVDDVENWASRVRAVTGTAVRDAARAWLDKRRSVTGYLIKTAKPPEEKRS